MQALGPNQKQFLAALRSGDYEQGSGVLCNNNRYCCLGVASVLAGCERSISQNGINAFDGEQLFAPEAVVRNLSLRSKIGSAACLQDSLIRLNDRGETFSQIADIIESDPSVYFTEPR